MSLPEPPIVDYGQLTTDNSSDPASNPASKEEWIKYTKKYEKPAYAVALTKCDALTTHDIEVSASTKMKGNEAHISLKRGSDHKTVLNSAGCAYFFVEKHQPGVDVGVHVFEQHQSKPLVKTAEIQFDTGKFSGGSIPKVVAWFGGIDVAHDHAPAMKLKTDKVTQAGFSLEVITEMDCEIHAAKVGWCAYDPAESNLFHGQFTLNNHGGGDSQPQPWDIPNKGAKPKVAPQLVLYGINGVNSQKHGNFAFDLSATKVDRASAAWSLTGSVSSVDCFYIAINMNKFVAIDPQFEPVLDIGMLEGNKATEKIIDCEKFPERGFPHQDYPHYVQTMTKFCIPAGQNRYPSTNLNFFDVTKGNVTMSTQDTDSPCRSNYFRTPQQYPEYVPIDANANFNWDILENQSRHTFASGVERTMDGFQNFDDPPNMCVWISSVRLDTKRDHKIAISVTEVTNKDYRLKCSTTAKYGHGLGVCGLAWPKKPDYKNNFISGTFNLPGGSGSGRIDFSPFGLKSAPNVIGWGPTEFEFKKDGNMGYDFNITDVTAQGANWAFKAAGEMGPGKASWLAQRTD